MKVLRADDIPLLYAQLEELGIERVIDGKVATHGNWSGVSLGRLVSMWVCHLLSEGDHRLCSVEDWAADNLALLSTLCDQQVKVKDFTDDRLEAVLDYLGEPGNWSGVNVALAGNCLEVYDMDPDKTVRLDAAPMQGHHSVKASRLFEYGYGKHHNPKLGMMKVMLACVDNEVNGFGYPLAHLTVGGATADDALYVPMVEECERVFAAHGEPCGKLYVGDSKMGSLATRGFIRQSGNDYLCPLGRVQLSGKERLEEISSRRAEDFKRFRNEEGELVAEGFDTEAEVGDGDGAWKERRVYVRSLAYAASQDEALERKLEKASAELSGLLAAKQGKKRLRTEADVQLAVDAVLSRGGVEGLLEVSILEERHSREVRGYGGRPAREESWSTFELAVERDEAAVAGRKGLHGWQVYATTVDAGKLDFAKIVRKYRGQNRIESRFNDLRNKLVPLLPIFLKKDNRIEGLVNLLMICLKVCCVMEFKAAKKLRERGAELAGVYEGNPKRSTPRPTAKRMLRQFRGISIVLIVLAGESEPQVRLTDLTETQLEIIDLLGFKPSIYTDLIEKLKLSFPRTEISETQVMSFQKRKNELE